MHAGSSDQLKVCHLILPGPMAGAEKVVLAGCKALLSEPLDLTLAIISEIRNPSMAEGFTAAAKELSLPIEARLQSRKRVDFALLGDMRGFLRDKQFHILHTHGYKALLYGRAACPPSTQVIHTHHGDTSRSLTTRLYQWLAYHQMKRIDAVCAVSQQMHANLQRSIPAHKLHLVENMLATPLPACPDQPKVQPKESEKRMQLVALGRLSKEKGLDILLQALATIPQPRPRVTLVGEGGQESELRALTEQLKITSDVFFAGFQTDIVPILAESDAIVMPSLREGLPLSLIEAAAFGLPAIATHVGGIPSVIQHSANGLLCEPGDVEAFGNCLREFCRDSEQLKASASQRASAIRNRFSPATWAKKTFEIYEQVSNRHA